MTDDEVAGLLSYLAEQYPNAAPPGDPRRRVVVWADVLRPFSSQEMLAAARTHVRSGNKWFPTPAELCAIRSESIYGALPAESEAWGVCTSHLSPERLAMLHPVLREVVEITGGINTLSWMDERDMRRHVRSAYFTALRSYEISRDPELPEAPMSERRLGGPRSIGGWVGAIGDGDDT